MCFFCRLDFIVYHNAQQLVYSALKEGLVLLFLNRRSNSYYIEYTIFRAWHNILHWSICNSMKNYPKMLIMYHNYEFLLFLRVILYIKQLTHHFQFNN